jgi:hypothetical protein
MIEHEIIRAVAMTYAYSTRRIYGRAPIGRDATQDERQRIAEMAIAEFDASGTPDANTRMKDALLKAEKAVLYP